MFDDRFFDQWLDTQFQQVMQKVVDGHGIQPEEVMILMLKTQTNHFAHPDQDLHNEMIALRQNIDKRFQESRLEMEKRFEQVDKRFEQVDKRLEQLIGRMDRLMLWSLGRTVSAAVFVVNYLKWHPWRCWRVLLNQRDNADVSIIDHSSRA